MDRKYTFFIIQLGNKYLGGVFWVSKGDRGGRTVLPSFTRGT